MMKFIYKQSLVASAAIVVGLMGGINDAMAADTSTTGAAGKSNFGGIAKNIQESIADLPGLLTGVSYMMGIMLGVLGILKIKDHVENPSSIKIQDGAIRLAAGGALFALPIVYEAMQSTIGEGSGPQIKNLEKVPFGVN